MSTISEGGAAELLANLSVPAIVLIAAILTCLRLALLRRKVRRFGKPPEAHPFGRWLAEILEAFIVAGMLVFLLIRPFFLQAFYIPSGSMEPTLLGHEAGRDLVTGVDYSETVHDHIFVNRLVYRMGDPQRGDIIVFKAPPEADEEDRYLGLPLKENTLIKRCIGLPGDTIWVHDGAVWRKQAGQTEFKKLVETYLDPKLPLEDPQPNEAIFATRAPLTLGTDQYFALGDNRNHSRDSRFWGAVERKRILGKAVFIFFPFTRLHPIH